MWAGAGILAQLSTPYLPCDPACVTVTSALIVLPWRVISAAHRDVVRGLGNLEALDQCPALWLYLAPSCTCCLIKSLHQP